jgi:glycine betaine/proline transport system ATP-binding protein
LSGGQQQRVGIARSLAIEPDIWFLDEPFSALDPLIRREMQDEFLRLQDMLGKTIVFITHDFDEALRLADRIAIMKDGAVEQCDTPDQIVLNPATEYVRKFTEEIDKARVVHARVLTDANAKGTGDPVAAGATIQELARKLVNDSRDIIPVADGDTVIGAMKRQDGLDILLGQD